jgi:vitamin B12 transporter
MLMLLLLRSGLFMFLISSALATRAQQDTTVLKELVVYGLPIEKYLAGSGIVRMDSSLQKNYSSNYLGEVLSFQFPVYFRNYGNGMLSGISMRGTSPQHTAVLWNGININNFSLGQSDFSILPMIAFDEIKVHAGGGSAYFGSGAFGGSVLLNSVRSDRTPLISLKQDIGSFGRYSTSAKVSLGNGPLSSSTSFYRLQSKNDFPIIGFNQRQQHAAILQQGMIEDLQYNLSANRLISLHYWYHDANREIQPTIGKYNNLNQQQDRNHRLVTSYQQNGVSGMFKATAGVVDDVIVFNANKSEILRWLSSASHQYSFTGQWHTKLGAEWNHIIGKIKEYNGVPKEDRIDIAASLQRDYKKNSFSFNLRQPFISRVNAPLLPYLGTNLIIYDKPNQQFVFNANISKNFRAPTLNDRYWQSAGRQDLKPEVSYAAEAGLSWKSNVFSIGTKSFYQLIDQWIQWVPDSNGNYRPQNIKQVRMRGLEASIESEWRSGRLSFHSRASYQFVRSITTKAIATEAASIGKQLIYTPVHTGNAFVSVGLHKWSFNLSAQYAGKRFTEGSNSDLYSLNPYAFVDMAVSKWIAVKRNDFRIQLSVKNILNANYQMYSGYAMPGRNFNLQLSYQLKSK